MDKKPVILHVDDDIENLKMFRYTFEDEFTIYESLSVKDALEILKNITVEVVVSDQRMPEINGIEFCQIISVEYPDIIKIMLTAYTDIKEIINAINAGDIYRFITKP